MFAQIAYYPILGKPLMMYLGLLTLLSLCTTATLGYLVFKGKFPTGFKWHIRMAVTTLCLGFIHGTLGILALFVG
jgi:hypothetical protein